MATTQHGESSTTETGEAQPPGMARMLIEPAVAVVVAALLLGQILTWMELLGGVVILLAVVIVQRPDPRADLARPLRVDGLGVA